MDGGIRLRGCEHHRLLTLYRRHGNPAVRLRAHIILLLADGYTWAMIAAILYCSSKTISTWKKRFEIDGVAALRDEHRGRRPDGGFFSTFWSLWVVQWVTQHTPREFGLRRSRWCCRVIVILLLEVHQVRVSAETVRRWLHRHDLVWRRPRPALRPIDPRRQQKIAAIRRLLRDLPQDEVAVFQDEVDINSNPKIGAMWMPKGQQAQILTPGTNQKRYLAGSMNWRTGALIITEGAKGQGRDSALFIAHLDDLRTRLRRYHRIHVICDNARFHKSAAVRAYLADWSDRLCVHFLPTYCPQANPIERVWWKLHEEITRDHECADMDELLDLVFEWLDACVPQKVEDQMYFHRKAA